MMSQSSAHLFVDLADNAGRPEASFSGVRSQRCLATSRQIDLHNVSLRHAGLPVVTIRRR